MFLSLEGLRNLERDTLQVIDHIGEFNEFGELVELARNHRTILSGDRGPIDLGFRAVLNLRFRGDTSTANTRRAVFVGALVEPTADGRRIERSSYSLTICKAERQRAKILRKLHFDYEPIERRAGDECKPSMHIQVCGKLMPLLERAGYRQQDLDAWSPWLEKPRIPGMPMSLALLLNWLLLEFDSDVSAARILRNHQWKNLVARAEEAVLAPYFKSCAEFFAAPGANRGKRFVESLLYEMAG
jgi:hypothetical protein